MLGSLLPYAASATHVLPALVLTLLAYGAPALTPAAPGSVVSRTKRVLQPEAAPEAGAKPQVALGRTTYLVLEAAVGVTPGERPPAARPVADVAADLWGFDFTYNI